jgi:type II secretory pathway component GspD/PulD (secretin)/tetratricopeptide (TPR) repeat protein
MSPTTYLTVRSLLLAAVAFSGVHAAPALALTTNTADTQPSADANAVLDRVSTLIADKQLIRARAMLLALQDSPTGATMSDEQGQRLWSLLANIERQIQRTDRLEISLQKAELAYANDNLVEANRQANAVLRSSKSTSQQISSAQAVLDLVETRQIDASNKVANAIASASTAFESGDYAGAKSLLIRIGQLGLDLPADLQETVDSYKDRIAQLEQSHGQSFGSFNPAMGMLAPEKSENSDWLLGHAQDGPKQDGARSGSFLGQPEDETQAQPIDIELVGEEPQEAPAEVELVVEEPVVEQPQVDLLEVARRFEAQNRMGQANIAFEERQFNKALELYNEIINSFSAYVSPEELQLATDRRAEAQVQLNTQGGPEEDILTETVTDTSLIRQRAEASFNNYLQQAQQALAEGDTNTARNLAAQADLTIKRARNAMPESAFEQYLDSVANLITQINTTENQLRIAEAEAEKLRLAQETASLAAERNRERDSKIIENLKRVHALQQELKYEEALEVVESILFLDPGNPSGLLLKDIIEDTLVYRENMLIQRKKSKSMMKQDLIGQEAMIIPDSVMAYPDDWPQISFRRGDTLEFAESEANRSVLATLRDTRMPVEFNDNAFEDVMAFIGSTTNIDIDIDWESLADIGVDPDTPVDLKLKSVKVSVLLDRVLSKVSDPTLPAGWSIQDGILTIASDEVLRLNTLLETYDIRDLIFVVPDFNTAPNFNLQTAVSSANSGGGGGGQSPFTGGNRRTQDEPREDRVEAIVNLIQANVDPDGWTALGGDTSSITELNGNFIITTTPKNHRAIIGLLNKLRQQRAVQINVETRFLSVDQNFFEQIGFDLDVYFNANNTEYQLARTIDPSLLPSDYFDANGTLLDNVSGGGFFDANGDGIITQGETITQPVLGPGFNGGTLPNGQNLGDDSFSVIRAAQNSFGLTNELASAGTFASQILGLNPALGVTGRFLDDIQVDFLVQATQADQRSVVLTAPRLTFTNGQRSFIAVVTQTTFISDLTPVVGSSAGAFDPVVTPISDGVVIDITGVASADRRYVTLTIRTTQSKVSFGQDRQVQGATGAAGNNNNNSSPNVFTGSIQVPIIIATQLNTTVTIPDQGTVLLGGQRIIEELEVETGVPVLSKIPILSRFFSNRIDTKSEKTLLVLLKPTILIQNEEEELNFPGLLDQLGR